ncbi:pro-neuregulin-2, membrane-bound isoform [Platysternon megacephalum]|uniref:Pro-neuregulin-2, membrane-bound isoform n=1 Tax=Platysternon megacephalum TaxID=55544 RepID=A0A4D9EZS2_9SAUR|nr:pro-neuregulin-2, membrane-bound isoform [Platysternon megacephalum]
MPQLSSGNKVPTNCLDVAGSSPPGYCYKVCLTPESAKSNFMFLKPYSPSPPRNNEKAAENLPGPGRKPQAANNTVSATSQASNQKSYKRKFNILTENKKYEIIQKG